MPSWRRSAACHLISILRADQSCRGPMCHEQSDEDDHQVVGVVKREGQGEAWEFGLGYACRCQAHY